MESKSIYIDTILADILTKCSDMDHGVLPANYTMYTLQITPS